MVKKNGSLLGITNSANVGLSNALVPQGSGHLLTEEDQRIVKEWVKQNLVIEGIQAQGNFAIEKIAEIENHALTTFVDTTGFILDIKHEQRSKEHQAYVDEFCFLAIQSVARNFRGVVAVVSTNISNTVHQSFIPPPEPPKPVSLLERLIG